MVKDSLDQKMWHAYHRLMEGNRSTTTPRQLMLCIGRRRRGADSCQEVRERLEDNNLQTVPDFEKCDFHRRIDFEWIDPARAEAERKQLMAIADEEQKAREQIEAELVHVYHEIQKEKKRERQSVLSRIINFLFG